MNVRLAALLLLAVFAYFFGLGGRHIPKNGDEYVYAHITRLTAASGRLLPLQSQLNGMRNTKPPLLFWQGIATTGWGGKWDLWNLRYPSVVYTLLTALLALAMAKKLSGRTETGVTATLVFLAFFSTYRYGRPFLADPALSFWLVLPFFTLLAWRPATLESRFVIPLLIGLEIGVCLCYKSFALVFPVGLALAGWYLHLRGFRLKTFLVRDSGKIVLSCASALALFGLWFLVDPDPTAVWNEFVVGENFGKLAPTGSSYLGKLLWGGTSIWSLALAFFANAGLLAFPLLGLVLLATAKRREISPEKALLWLLVASLFVAFSLPTQRSGRYLLPAMPVLAVLLALDWERIRRSLFTATLVCCGLLITVAAHLAFKLNGQLQASLYGWPYWLLLATVGSLVVVGLVLPRTTRGLALVAALLIYPVFSSFMLPLDGSLGTYSPDVRQRLQGRDVWVPCNFRAVEEGGFFLLPGAVVHGYRQGLNLTAHDLAARYPLFAFAIPVAENPAQTLRLAGPGCRVVAERIDLRSRHSSGELREMFLGGKLFELLFVRELLIESSFAPPDAAVVRASDGCR